VTVLNTNGEGYEELRVSGGLLLHHRVLAFVWGLLDSPRFSEDMRQVHHEQPIPWLNTEDNLTALTPQEHREVDDGRARITTPWDRRVCDG